MGQKTSIHPTPLANFISWNVFQKESAGYLLNLVLDLGEQKGATHSIAPNLAEAFH